MALLMTIGLTLMIIGFIEFDDWCTKQWRQEDYESFIEEGTGND